MQHAQIETRFVIVSGEAEVMATPDIVTIAFGVETVSNELDKAKAANDEIVRGTIAEAEKIGISVNDIQTDYLEIEPKYERYEKKREFLGYHVRKSMVITLKDISKLETILEVALTMGVNYVHGISFQTTHLKAHRDKARSLATQAARAKAETLAQELNQKIGRPLSIEEETSGVRLWNKSWWGSHHMPMYSQIRSIAGEENGLEGEGSIAPGQIAVGAKIRVKFEIE